MKTKNGLKAAVLAALLIALVIVGQYVPLRGLPGVAGVGQAAPPAAPTPVADFLVPASSARAFNFETATAITADANTTGVEVMGLGAVDIQYTIVHTPSGEVQTTTLTVQYSNDNTNWANGVALTTSSVVNGNDITRVPVFGRYMRINKDVSSNAKTVTTTLTAVGR